MPICFIQLTVYGQSPVGHRKPTFRETNRPDIPSPDLITCTQSLKLAFVRVRWEERGVTLAIPKEQKRRERVGSSWFENALDFAFLKTVGNLFACVHLKPELAVRLLPKSPSRCNPNGTRIAPCLTNLKAIVGARMKKTFSKGACMTLNPNCTSLCVTSTVLRGISFVLCQNSFWHCSVLRKC